MKNFSKQASILTMTFSLLTACGTLSSTPTSQPSSQPAEVSLLFADDTSIVSKHFRTNYPNKITSTPTAASQVLLVNVTDHTAEQIQNHPVFKEALQKQRQIIFDSDGSEASKNKIATLTEQIFGFEMRSAAVQITTKNPGEYSVVALPDVLQFQKMGTNTIDAEIFAQESDLPDSTIEETDLTVRPQLAAGNDGERRIWPIHDRIQNEIHLRGAIFFADTNWSRSTKIKEIRLPKVVTKTLTGFKCTRAAGCYYNGSAATSVSFSNSATTGYSESLSVDTEVGMSFEGFSSKIGMGFTRTWEWTKTNTKSRTFTETVVFNDSNSPKAKNGQCLFPKLIATPIMKYYAMEGLWFRTQRLGKDKQEVKWEPWNVMGTAKQYQRTGFYWRIDVTPNC